MSAGECGVTSRMCQTFSEDARGVHCSVKPKVGDSLGGGTGICIVRVRWPFHFSYIISLANGPALYSIDGREKGKIITFALQRVRATFVPAQLRISVAKRAGSGESIGRPLMPMTKSYHGSIAMSSFLLRRTWKPTALGLVLECRDCPSESRREMNRFRAPNIVML